MTAKRARDEFGQAIDDVDFGESLAFNLDNLGIVRYFDPSSPQKRKWHSGGMYLGSFDAHDGWTVLRHFNRSGNWLSAVKAATIEFAMDFGY